MKGFSIGGVRIDNPLILAPMEHVTGSVFRRIVKPFGAGLVFTEFCASDGLIRGREKLWNMIKFQDSERPVAVQIFGSHPATMAECAKRIEDLGADILDINCGCSVPKMEKCRAGAYLAKDLPLLGKVMEAVRRAVKIPVTLKIRKGWDPEQITCFEIARMAEELGFCAISIHGRTSLQGYGGRADWETIDAVARTVRIPVIGNGDVKDLRDAQEKLSRTAVSGAMIGRAAMGTPWIFSGSSHGREEKKKAVLNHLDLAFEELQEKEALLEMRRHLVWYLRDLPRAASYRAKVLQLTMKEDLRSAVEAFFS